MKISDSGLELIAHFEGFSSKPYLCPAGVLTIGYGTTIYSNGKHVKMSDDNITKDEALEIMRDQIDKTYGTAVNRYVQIELTQNQFDALTSFTYNLGAGNLRSSTLLRKLNQGKMGRAGREFLKWDRAGGRKLAGLTRRRKAEMELFVA